LGVWCLTGWICGMIPGSWPHDGPRRIVSASAIRIQSDGMTWTGYEFLLAEAADWCRRDAFLDGGLDMIPAPLLTLIDEYAVELCPVRAVISREQQCCEVTGDFFELSPRPGRDEKSSEIGSVDFPASARKIQSHLQQMVGRYLVRASWGPDRRHDADREYRAAIVRLKTVRGRPKKSTSSTTVPPITSRQGDVFCRLQTERPRTVTVVLHNTHNGYYAHEVRLTRGSIIDTNTL